MTALRPQRRWVGRVCIAGLVALALLPLTTCRTPRARLPLDPAASAEPHLPRTVRVLLAGLESSERVEVQTSAGPVAFWRQGQRVVRSSGESGPRLWLSAPGPLVLAGRTYLGTLELEPHAKGGLRVFLECDLERYVEGVVAAELPLWSALPAELQAQAIAVRTYTAYTLAQHPEPHPYLWDGVQDQAFRGQFVPGASQGEQRAAVRLSRAVEATRGLVLLQGGRVLDVRYHAACGGLTANRASLFPGTAPSAMVACDPCAQRAAAEAAAPAERRPLTWTAQFAPQDLDRLAREAGVGEHLTLLQVIEQDTGGRWQRVRVQGNKGAVALPLDTVRKTLGYATWKSGRVLALDPANGVPG
ncbi:MAG TPA: SpoIID/LytB domain-containing protein, partial [Planctomycetota bacterium]|nr:SpoIID/LytB domain-containing protein [Planctomycetota bacterium]